MSATFVILAAPETQTWHVARVNASECRIVPVEGTESHESFAERIATALQGLKYSQESTLLAIPSSMCLCASVDNTGLRQRSRNSGLLFRLEEQLPIAIEEMVADFIDGESHSLGVATLIETASAMINSLESLGIAIASICPTALLIADEFLRNFGDSEKLDGAVVGLDTQINLLIFRARRIVEWACFPVQPSTLRMYLRYAAMQGEEPLQLSAIGIDETFRNEVMSVPGILWINHSSLTPFELAARSAERILAGETQPPIELRRGQLAERNAWRHLLRPLQTSLIAFALLCISLAGSMAWRAHRYDSLAGASLANQLKAFEMPPFRATHLRLASSAGCRARKSACKALAELRQRYRLCLPSFRFCTTHWQLLS